MSDSINKIIPGDCLKLFQDIPDNSIDMTFADPPFNLRKQYNSSQDDLALKHYLAWCEQWLLEMVRVTKPTGSIFIHNIPKWLTYFAGYLNTIAHFKHWITWDAATAPMGKTLQPAHYGILFYVKNPKQHKCYELRYPHKRCRKCGMLHKDYGGKKALLHPFGSLVSDVWTDIHRIRHNKYRDKHPCQLPIHLLERLILMATDAGEIILDPFSGTGTSLIAAKRLGRQYIGFELAPAYVNIIESKLSKEAAHSKIGTSWVSFFLNEIITLRDKDWSNIAPFYQLPEPIQAIDHTKIKLKSGLSCDAQNNASCLTQTP